MIDILDRLEQNSRRTSYRPGVDELMLEAAAEIRRLREEVRMWRLGGSTSTFAELQRQNADLRERLAEAEDVLDSFSACPHPGNCRNCVEKLAKYIRRRKAAIDAARGEP